MTDHIKASLEALDQTDISSSLAHGQVAVATHLRGIEAQLTELVALGAKAVGVVLDGRDIGIDLDLEAEKPVPFAPVPDPAAARAYLIEQLAEHLEATYARITVTPHWPILAEAALDWMEK
ncbi:hypothetical protein CH274_15565 [Rhodococcus sp. 06-418-5]|uniref:hypothetical protein n=1 Tax=Rhodococcus sp. 06-418-5 TaxID=2022507 RepID=UPI000B9AD2CB|nr:hypothetical protein [Rhodococcus sp. 06-418-5]OZC80586.1 hypothetical protein CH274_15565 [Rhodococcus sp. 06-418-5]